MHLSNTNSPLSNDVIQFGNGYEVTRGLEVMKIGNSQYKLESLNQLLIMDLPRLKSIEIGKWSFKYVREFEICNCPELISLQIGYASFRIATETDEITGDDGIVQIHDCSKLQSIKMDGHAFLDYHIFEIRGMI